MWDIRTWSRKRQGVALGVVVVLVLGFFLWPRKPLAPTFLELTDQLQGKTCSYQLRDGVVERHGFWDHRSRRGDAEWCIVDATLLLEQLHGQGDSIPYLLAAVRANHDIDAVDTIIPVRTTMIEVLGRAQDPRALPLLRELLESDDQSLLAADAPVPKGYIPRAGTTRKALRDAIGHIAEDN